MSMYDPKTVAAAAARSHQTNSLQHHRGLQYGSDGDDNEGGFFPLFAFFLVCWIVFVIVKKCCFSRRNQPIQASHPNINAAAGAAGISDNGGDLLSALTPQERKAYVADLLKSEKYQAASPEESVDDSTSVESENDDENAQAAIGNTGDEGDIELGDVDRYIDEELAATHKERKSHCAICLDAYKDGDLVCSSNNPECAHRFHRACMEDWLQKHEECPCCRRSYLHKDITVAGDD